MLGLAPDQCGEPLAQVVRGHQELARGRGRDAGGQLVEDRRRVSGQFGIRAEQPEVLVEPGRPLVVVTGADMDVAADAVGLLTHDQRELDVRFDPLHAVGDVSSCQFELLAPADVGRLVEACGDLDQDRYLLAAAGRVFERLDDRGAATGAVDRELDRENGGIGSGTLQELQDRGVEAVVRQVHQDIAAADLLEHRGRVGAVQVPQPRMGHRHVRRVTLLGDGRRQPAP